MNRLFRFFMMKDKEKKKDGFEGEILGLGRIEIGGIEQRPIFMMLVVNGWIE